MEISKIYVYAKEEKHNKTRAERCKRGGEGLKVQIMGSGQAFLMVPFVESPKTAQNTNLLPFKVHLIYYLGRERRTSAV